MADDPQKHRKGKTLFSANRRSQTLFEAAKGAMDEIVKPRTSNHSNPLSKRGQEERERNEKQGKNTEKKIFSVKNPAKLWEKARKISKKARRTRPKEKTIALC